MNELVLWVKEFFATFESKDWATAVISSCALIVSFFSIRQKAGEGKLALRKQLTEILERLNELTAETATINYRRGSDNQYPPNYSRLLTDRRRFLVRQAAFITAKIPDLISPYECLLIAGSFDAIDYTIQAEAFFERAVESDDLLDRGIATRGYARYLFNRDRIDDARFQYARAVACFDGDSDHLHSYRADTYERWALQESEWTNKSEAQVLLKKAIETYEFISNPSKRAHEVNRVKGLLAPIDTPEKLKTLAPSRKRSGGSTVSKSSK